MLRYSSWVRLTKKSPDINQLSCCVQIQVNFPMTVDPGSTIAHTVYNGATRQIPGTQNSHELIPWLEEDLEAVRSAESLSGQYRLHRLAPSITNMHLGR